MGMADLGVSVKVLGALLSFLVLHSWSKNLTYGSMIFQRKIFSLDPKGIERHKITDQTLLINTVQVQAPFLYKTKPLCIISKIIIFFNRISLSNVTFSS